LGYGYNNYFERSDLFSSRKVASTSKEVKHLCFLLQFKSVSRPHETLQSNYKLIQGTLLTMIEKAYLPQEIQRIARPDKILSISKIRLASRFGKSKKFQQRIPD